MQKISKEYEVFVKPDYCYLVINEEMALRYGSLDKGTLFRVVSFGKDFRYRVINIETKKGNHKVTEKTFVESIYKGNLRLMSKINTLKHKMYFLVSKNDYRHISIVLTTNFDIFVKFYPKKTYPEHSWKISTEHDFKETFIKESFVV